MDILTAAVQPKIELCELFSQRSTHLRFTVRRLRFSTGALLRPTWDSHTDGSDRELLENSLTFIFKSFKDTATPYHRKDSSNGSLRPPGVRTIRAGRSPNRRSARAPKERCPSKTARAEGRVRSCGMSRVSMCRSLLVDASSHTHLCCVQ